jgi:hypothetical protein
MTTPSFGHPPGHRRLQGITVPPLDRPGARDETVATMTHDHRQAKQAAWQTAADQGWEPWGQTDDTVYELMAIRGDWVCMLKTQNVTGAIAAGVNLIRETPPYDLSGAGLTVGVWDGGCARSTHREFGGRIDIMDGAMTVSHSTHVTGTICAAGIEARALGMAPAVSIAAYDFDEDLAEATTQAMSYAGEPGTIQVSNHSYGWVCGWDYSSYRPRWYGAWGARESDMFGNYDVSSSDWDALCYAAPYYLPFKAAGNDRADPAPSGGASFEYWGSRGWTRRQYSTAADPLADGWDEGGYDTITPDATAKNIVTIGAVNLATTSKRDLTQVAMTSFSAWGPTDDGRVKPDLVAHGVNLYSTTSNSDQSYGLNTGTSMSTAVASGTAILLCEYYGKLFPKQAMRAATLKGLLIHTADDLGRAGPDYCFGWGLINARAAAQHLRDHKDYPSAHRIIEDTVTTAVKSRSYAFTWDGASSIRATLVWTDPAGSELQGLDNTTPCLINDLDLRVLAPDGTVYFPFVLDLAQPDKAAGTGDNDVDNVEQVLIAAPRKAGKYYAQITYKGTLINAKQDFSLLISGQSLTQTSLAATSDDDPIAFCDRNSAQ